MRMVVAGGPQVALFSNKDQRVEALRRISIFSALPKKDIEAIARHVDDVHVDAGRKLAEEGRAPRQLFLIVNGKATVRRGGKKIATLGPGDTVGEMSLIDGGKQSADVIADEPCACLVVPAQEFRVLLDDAPGFERNLLKSLASRLRAADTQLAG